MRTTLPIVLMGLACAPRLPESDGRSDRRPALATIPEASLDSAPSVLWIVSQPAHDPEDVFVLVEGELSDYYVRKIGRGELPETLLERSVPMVSWREADRSVVVPSKVLQVKELYSLASQRHGLLGELRIAAGDPVWSRIWPPADVGGGGQAWYCAEQPASSLTEAVSLQLLPDGSSATAHPGVDSSGTLSERCVHLVVNEPFELAVPPPRIGPLAIEPGLLRRADLPPLTPRTCADPEVPLGPGCVLVEDDRIVLRSTEQPAFWIVAVPDGPRLLRFGPNERAVVGGFASGETLDLTGRVFDLAGRETPFQERLTLSAPLPRVVLNEVMANPNGAEPAQEWVELFNAGSIAVDLASFRLSDGVGETPLPAIVLEPGRFALVVTVDYDPGSLVDVAPASGTTLLWVESLGKSGLSNAGEPLFLLDGDGRVVSHVPPVPKPKAGISVARRSPDALDDAADAFALHADPGASPGAPNKMAD